MKKDLFTLFCIIFWSVSIFFIGRAYEREQISKRILSIPDFGTDGDYKMWNYIINNKKEELI